MNAGHAAYRILMEATEKDLKEMYDSCQLRKEILDKEANHGILKPSVKIGLNRFTAYSGYFNFTFLSYVYKDKTNDIIHCFSKLVDCRDMSLIATGLESSLNGVEKSKDKIRNSSIYTFPDRTYIEITKQDDVLSMMYREPNHGFISCIDVVTKWIN